MRTYESEIVNTRGHHLTGVKWPVIGSKGDTYYVEMTDYGFTCDCIAFSKCKHIKKIEKKFK